MDKKEQTYSCKEHIEIMIEEWVNDYELAPEIDLIENAEKAPCSWCEEDAVYYIIQTELDAYDDSEA